MSCECYKIGGPFIAEDPDCPAHGKEAQRARRQRPKNAIAVATQIMQKLKTFSVLVNDLSEDFQQEMISEWANLIEQEMFPDD